MRTALNTVLAASLTALLCFGINHLLGRELPMPLVVGVAAGVSFAMPRKAKRAEPSA